MSAGNKTLHKFRRKNYSCPRAQERLHKEMKFKLHFWAIAKIVHGNSHTHTHSNNLI